MELYVIALPFGDRCRHQPDHPTYPDHSRNTLSVDREYPGEIVCG
jgi:hypothetical protein